MRKIILLHLLIISSFAVCAQINIHDSEDSKEAKIKILMDYCEENGLFNGTVLVAEKGEVIYRAAHGYADYKTQRKLTPETAFYLASVSKQFTTMAIMILMEDGKLTYQDKLRDYLPKFPKYAKGVTVQQLMTHTSGVANHYRLNAYKPDLSNKDVYKLLVKQKALDFKPGEQYAYSNGGYVSLAMIAEKASGQPFHEFMYDHVFKPLQMDRTLVYDESKPDIDNRAIGYNAVGELDDYEILTTGAGGMYSTIDDLFKWDRALYTEDLVSQATLNEAFTSARLNNGENTYYGYGWSIQNTDEGKRVSHGGSLNGFRTFIQRDLNSQNTQILLTNSGDAFAQAEISQAINNILSGKEYDLPKLSISDVLSTKIKDMPIEEAMSSFRVLIGSKRAEYKEDEMGINSLGYRFLGKNMVKEAIAVFQLNTELYPNSSNVYDSLGEALLKEGKRKEAIENYKKSIRLNPNNTHGIEVLKKEGVDISNLTEGVSVPKKILESYVGDYELAPGFKLTISREGKKLFILPTGQQKSQILPSTNTRFYSQMMNAQITFNTNEDGDVDSLTFHRDGVVEAKKVR